MKQVYSTVRNSRRSLLLLGMAALLVGAAMTSKPQSAMAATLRPVTCIYYTDATHSVTAGFASFRCNGSTVFQSGTKTPFSVCDYDYCCGNVWC